MTLKLAPIAAALSLAFLSACVVEDRVILHDSYPRPYYYAPPPPPAVYWYAPPRHHHHGRGPGWGGYGYRRW